ncbi:hypothetical protein SAMN05443270_0005 [Lacrimispora sphenoides]|nr:hypothetical protein SAMN05443270_0005 [Lacrimispora sphenoides]
MDLTLILLIVPMIMFVLTIIVVNWFKDELEESDRLRLIIRAIIFVIIFGLAYISLHFN